MEWDVIIANGTVVDQGEAGVKDVRVQNGCIGDVVPAAGGYPARARR